MNDENTSDDVTPEEQFTDQAGHVMMEALENGADPDALATSLLNLVRLLYGRHGAGEDASTYVGYVASESHEIMHLLDWVEDTTAPDTGQVEETE